jgi:hypothetical protein
MEPAGGLIFGVALSILLIEILLRIATPMLPLLYQRALFGVEWVPLEKPPKLPEPLWRADDKYGSVIRKVENFDAALFEGSKSATITTDNWLDPMSHVNFRTPTSGWHPRWPVDAIVIGDSFGFCNNNYEDCWVQILDSKYGLSMANLSLAGTGSLSHLRVLQTFGPANEPRFVIWQWWGNDFNDDYAQLYGSQGNNVVVTRPESFAQTPTPESPIAIWLSKYSATYNILKLVFQGTRAPSPDYLIDPYHYNNGSINISYGRSYIERAFDLGDERNELGFEATLSELVEAQAFLDASSTPLVLVLIPTKEETYRSDVEDILGADWFEKVSDGRLRLMDYCQTKRILCIDATSAFQEHANRGEQLYWPDDVHLNAQGNQVLAEAIWQYLVLQGLAGH